MNLKELIDRLTALHDPKADAPERKVFVVVGGSHFAEVKDASANNDGDIHIHVEG